MPFHARRKDRHVVLLLFLRGLVNDIKRRGRERDAVRFSRFHPFNRVCRDPAVWILAMPDTMRFNPSRFDVCDLYRNIKIDRYIY